MANRVNITLPPFWADNAAGWFAHMESRFRAKQIFEEWDRPQQGGDPAVLRRRGAPGRGRALHAVEGRPSAAAFSDKVPED
jgi:hypothetical protein